MSESRARLTALLLLAVLAALAVAYLLSTGRVPMILASNPSPPQ